MIKITYDEIRKIAHMSHIAIYEDEIEIIKQQLEQVLTYAARVQEMATNIQGPRTKNTNVFREDVVVRQDCQKILAQAPVEEGGYFVVPIILESNN
jgi:aspartyl-tRNA(Asn)/glutamyl-tRNA(Gln) amidotransferase subunit C